MSNTTYDPDVMTAAVPPAGFEVNLINPPYIGYELVAVAVAFSCLSTIIVVLRLYTRKFIVKSLGNDDIWITLSWFFGLVFSIADCMQTKYGAGTHLWDVTITKFGTFLKWQMLLGTSYIATLACAKVAICVFYLRLSPDKTFRIMVYITIAFTLAYNLAGALVVIFSCNPIAASWDMALAALPTTKCVNRPADYLAAASLNIFTDLAIFALPIPTIWRLQLPIAQRLSVLGIFATGLFVTIVSVIRIKSVVHLLGSSDLTYDTSDLLLWSTIEAHVTIACACLPTLKPLVKRIFPSLSDSTAKQSGYPSIPGRSHKLDSEHQGDQSFAMKSYRERAGNGRVDTNITSGAQRQKYGDNDSQEFIMGQDDGKDGVYVTKEVIQS